MIYSIHNYPQASRSPWSIMFWACKSCYLTPYRLASRCSLRFHKPTFVPVVNSLTANRSAPPQRLLSWQVHNFLLSQGYDHDGYGGSTWHFCGSFSTCQDLMTTFWAHHQAPKPRSQLEALDTVGNTRHYAVYDVVAWKGHNLQCWILRKYSHAHRSPHESGLGKDTNNPTNILRRELCFVNFRALIKLLFSMKRNFWERS
jgi:hypothetical protein